MPRSDSKRSLLILEECRVVEEDRNREREEVEQLKRLLEMQEAESEKGGVNRDHSRLIQGKSKGGRKRKKSKDERRGKSR